MADSKKFHRVYTIQIKGRTRTNFGPDYIKETFKDVADSLGGQYKDTEIEMREHKLEEGLTGVVMTEVWKPRRPKQQTKEGEVK
jgi:hypothetical protein